LKAEREEQLKPDREKLLAFADSIEKMPLPITGVHLTEVNRMIRFMLSALAYRIRELINEKVK
jgi:hypothetical protein